MSVKKLRAKKLGFLENIELDTLPVEASGPSFIRRGLLVYEGEFMSMDGEVQVTKEDVLRLVSNHNAVIRHCCNISGEANPMNLAMKDYPPLQLDHSSSARDTIGRLIGEIEAGPYIRKDGSEVLAVYGWLLFLGQDNIEKASDGRYTHLSVGVDFEKGEFSELTITPFPAAPEASLLSKSSLASWKKSGEGFVSENEDIKAKVWKIKSHPTLGEIWGYDVEPKKSGNYRGIDGQVSDGESGAKRKAEEAARQIGYKLSQGEKKMSLLDKMKALISGEEKRLAAAVYVGKGVSGQGYYFENGNIYDEDGEHIGRAPNAEEAKKFVNGNRKKLSRVVKKLDYQGKKIEIKEDPAYANKGDADQEYQGFVNGKMICSYGDIGSCVEYCKEKIDDKKLSKGDEMDKDKEELKKKLKKHLTEKEELSEEEAEKKLSEASDEELKKLSAEADEDKKELSEDKDKDELSEGEDDDKKELSADEEEDKDELSGEETEDKKELKKKKLEDGEDKEEKTKKLSSARAAITRLGTDFRKTYAGAQLAAKRGQIVVRLGALKAKAKITPAEIKKMNLDQLSAKSQEVIDEVLKSYEDREPVIHTGQYGSIKADELHKLSRQVKMSKLEAETRANMSMLKGTVKASAEKKEELSQVPDNDASLQGQYNLERACDEVGRLMDEGKKDEAKLKMREHLSKALSQGGAVEDQLSSGDTEKQLSALAESANKMQAQFEELYKLVGPLVGMK